MDDTCYYEGEDILKCDEGEENMEEIREEVEAYVWSSLSDLSDEDIEIIYDAM